MPGSPHRLVLDLSYSAEELRATLFRSGHDGGPLETMQTWAVRRLPLARIRSLYSQITAVLNRANRWGGMDRGSRELLRQRGQLLFDEVLPAPIKEALRRLGGGELTLMLDEALVFLPFELMHSGGGFIGLDWAIGRIVRTPHAVVGACRPEPVGPWRMLVLCDPRGDLMGSYYEGITIRDELDASHEHLDIDLRSSEVGVGDVKQLIREYDIIHYAGHAELHPERPADSGWLLSDGILGADDLLDLAGGPSFPRVVFSNACRSGRVNEPTVADDHGEAIFSVANAFLLSGVHHYIGTLWDIPDEPACQFSLAFYEALTAGAGLGEALRRARLSLVSRYGDDSVLWASYVLYGDPSVTCIGTLEARPPRGTPSPVAAPPRAAASPLARPSATRVRGHARLAFTDLGAPPSLGWREHLARHWVTALVMIAATATLALFAATRGDRAPSVADGPWVAETGAATFPAPRDLALEQTTALAAAPAAVAIDAAPRGPELVVVAQRADAAGVFHDEPLEAGAALHSWDNFQLRVRLGEPGHIAVWHIESQGAISRIHPADGLSARVDNVGWVDLPGHDRWFYLDERRGLERFVLGWSRSPLIEDRAFTAALALQAKALARARARAQPNKDTLTLRGLGGTRDRPTATSPPPDERRVMRTIDALFAARYEQTRAVAFRHR